VVSLLANLYSQVLLYLRFLKHWRINCSALAYVCSSTLMRLQDGQWNIRKLPLMPAHLQGVNYETSRQQYASTIADEVILICAKSCRWHADSQIFVTVTWEFVSTAVAGCLAKSATTRVDLLRHSGPPLQERVFSFRMSARATWKLCLGQHVAGELRVARACFTSSDNFENSVFVLRWTEGSPTMVQWSISDGTA
jgi:hypothetical protein